METQSPREGSQEWEEAWVLCPCSLCKWQKRRRRRISLQHVEKNGEFDKNLLLQCCVHNEVLLEFN